MEEGEVLGRLVDARCDQNGIASLGGQTGLHGEVKDDIGNDPIHPRSRTQKLLLGSPLLFKFILLPVVQPLGLCVEPLVDLLRCANPLVDVSGFIDQVEHDVVLDRFAKLVGVDVASEHLEACRLVFL